MLASRTQAAMVEIQDTIEQLQRETNNIASKTDNTVQQAKASCDIILDIGKDVSALSDSANSIMDMSTQISHSADEQSAVANEIARELSDIRNQSCVIRSVAEHSAVAELSEASIKLNFILTSYRTE